MKKKFNFYSDPGHGWLKVSKKLIQQLGIEDQITTYSYMRNDFVYLEEDCDASTFINAYEAKYGVKIEFKYNNSNRDSKIRSYATYNAEAVKMYEVVS